MKRIAIIPDDQFVSIDSRGFNDLDMSSLPADIHAVQWYEDQGEIEYKADTKGNKPDNKKISSMADFEIVINLWQEACAIADEPPPAPGIDEMRTSLSNAVQTMLDTKASERNYDSIMSACSYIASSNPQFADEAMACVLWRDAVWAECYSLMDKVMSGEMPVPTAEELIAMLPRIEWPS